MVERRGLLFFFFFASCILIFAGMYFVRAADVDGVVAGGEKLTETIDKTAGQLEDEKWEYLSNSWRELLLKNKVIAGFDSLLHKGSIGFQALFGRPYELSFTFWTVFILWVTFFFDASYIFRSFSTFSPGISSIIAFGVTVIAAQIGVFTNISDVIFKIIFYKSGIWPWIWLIVLIFVLALFIGVGKLTYRFVVRRKKNQAKQQQALNQKVLDTTVKGITDAAKRVR